MPPLPKDKAKRQNRNPRQELGLVVVSGAECPAPAPGKLWLAVSRDDWLALWASSLSGTYDKTTDVPALRRLFDLRDSRERYSRAVQRRPMVTGSTGQPVAHPLAKQIPTLDGEIRQLEDRFGLNPAARLRLGITFGEAAKTLADLNADMEDDDDERFAFVDVVDLPAAQ